VGHWWAIKTNLSQRGSKPEGLACDQALMAVTLTSV
jgi:hypothetical protein